MPDKPVPLKTVIFISLRKFGFVFSTFYLMINYLAALSEPKKRKLFLNLLRVSYDNSRPQGVFTSWLIKNLAYLQIWNMRSFFDLYAYSLKLAESICKLWLRCCTWEKFFGTIIFLDSNSRLMNSSCFIKLAVILKKNSKKNNNIS